MDIDKFFEDLEEVFSPERNPMFNMASNTPRVFNDDTIEDAEIIEEY